MIPGPPSPWLILATVLALLGAFVGGNLHGHRAERTTWEALTAKATVTATTAARQSETQIATLKDETEKAHSDALTKIDDAYKRGLTSGRLRDKGAKCSPVSANPAPAGSPPEPATGCELSGEAERFLRGFARDADLAAAYGIAGHEYAVGLPGAVNGR